MNSVQHLRFYVGSKLFKRVIRICNGSSLNHSRKLSSSTDNRFILSPKETIEYPKISLSKCLFDAYEKHPDRVFLINGDDGSSYTFAETRERSLRFSSVLARLGVSKGDMVAINSPNCPEFVIALLGAINLGAIVTTVSPSFIADEISRQLNDSEASIMICHPECYAETRKSLKSAPSVRRVLVIGDEKDDALSMHKLMQKDDGKGIPSRVEINPKEDIAILPYSSGTTGVPKGVMLTHESLVANIHQGMHPSVLPLSYCKDVTMSVLPMFHSYGIYLIFVSSLVGSTKVTMKKFVPTEYVNLIEKYKATTLPSVPPIISALCLHECATPKKLSSVKNAMVAAAPVGPALHKKFLNKFGSNIRFLEGYGMTELSPCSNFSMLDKFIPGSCGPPVPSTYEKVINVETGEALPLGQEGELLIKGPQVMKGYWKNEKATRETITEDGWLHTGDIAKFDEEGNVYIVDRLKELIKVKGLQVAPAELEDLLRTHPDVEDVAVVGVPHEKSGEVPKAFVVRKKNSAVAEDDIKSFTAERVSSYKQLAGGVEFLDVIPKAPSGKILRRLLRE